MLKMKLMQVGFCFLIAVLLFASVVFYAEESVPDEEVYGLVSSHFPFPFFCRLALSMSFNFLLQRVSGFCRLSLFLSSLFLSPSLSHVNT